MNLLFSQHNFSFISKGKSIQLEKNALVYKTGAN